MLCSEQVNRQLQSLLGGFESPSTSPAALYANLPSLPHLAGLPVQQQELMARGGYQSEDGKQQPPCAEPSEPEVRG